MLETARSLGNRSLQTITGRKFRVGVYMDVPFFVPASTGLGRSDGRPAAERFLDRFNQTGSIRPRDYQDVTRNASYFVALVQEALHKRGPG